jgi:hypothetical protein
MNCYVCHGQGYFNNLREEMQEVISTDRKVLLTQPPPVTMQKLIICYYCNGCGYIEEAI